MAQMITDPWSTVCSCSVSKTWGLSFSQPALQVSQSDAEIWDEVLIEYLGSGVSTLVQSAAPMWRYQVVYKLAAQTCLVSRR